MVDDFRPSSKANEPVSDDEPAFVPPEEVAASEPDEITTEEETTIMPKQKRPNKLKQWWGARSKKQRIIIGCVVAGLLIGLIIGLKLVLKKTPPAEQPAIVQTEEPPKPTTEASHLTGVQIKPELNKRPVTGIMIENSLDARPQAGLRDAGVVFEAIAEGGITRFLALFLESSPKVIGPVRSARPYYIDWLKGYDATYVHVGGSPDALKKVRSLGVRDLDQFYNANAFERVTRRAAPHNVYTSMRKLLDLAKGKGYNSSDFTGFPRKEDAPLKKRKAQTINFAISGPDFNVQYRYDKKSNSYRRFEGGAKHTDETTKKQLAPKVVIALISSQGLAGDGLHTTYKTIGSGKAVIFQDGGVTTGTWSKDSSGKPLLFGDANGSPLALNAGQTWITILDSKSQVSYKP